MNWCVCSSNTSFIDDEAVVISRHDTKEAAEAARGAGEWVEELPEGVTYKNSNGEWK